MNQRRYTIKDVAKHAGVAVSTASLALNNKRYVSDSLKKKVQLAVEKLEYVPNRSARSLISKATGNIGFIVSEEHFSTAEPFYTRVFLGTEFAARQRDYYILLTTVPNKFLSSHLPRFVLERNVDGVILAGKISEAYAAAVTSSGIPAVVVDYDFKKTRMPAVNVDNKMGIGIAVEHLFGLGHTDIAFIGGDLAHPSIRLRLEGYRSAMERLGLKMNDALVSVDEPNTGVEDGYKALSKILDRKINFTAVVSCNDAVAIGAMRALKERSLSIPDDVSIVGFDDVELCEHVEPRLSSIGVPKEELGATALRILTQAIREGNHKISTVLIQPALVGRESTKQTLND
ncbi:MAG TPA: LacI family DNA-binding transcriptional regulator [Candidatus Kryptonia bacterium]